jgi:hypothetical protein
MVSHRRDPGTIGKDKQGRTIKAGDAMEWFILLIALGFLIWRLKSIKVEFWGQSTTKSLKRNEENEIERVQSGPPSRK